MADSDGTVKTGLADIKVNREQDPTLERSDKVAFLLLSILLLRAATQSAKLQQACHPQTTVRDSCSRAFERGQNLGTAIQAASHHHHPLRSAKHIHEDKSNNDLLSQADKRPRPPNDTET